MLIDEFVLIPLSHPARILIRDSASTGFLISNCSIFGSLGDLLPKYSNEKLVV